MAPDGNGNVRNAEIYKAVNASRLELGGKIDDNRKQVSNLDKQVGMLAVKLDNVCESTAEAKKNAAAVETEVDDLKVSIANSNKLAAAIAGGISAVINGAVAVFQAIR